MKYRGWTCPRCGIFHGTVNGYEKEGFISLKCSRCGERDEIKAHPAVVA